MTHTKECLAEQEAYEKEAAEYTAKWPNYCQKCGATGGFYSPGNRYEPPGVDECECLVEGKCPRCGQQAWTEDELADDKAIVCPHCGWDESRPHGFPEGPDCTCWMNN